MGEPLLIVGASARAAAFSALRGGFAPRTADLFADLDLAAQCPAVAVVDYPKSLLAAAAAGPAIPWLYTGALENSPDLVDAIAAKQPLLGNAGAVLRQVRDPVNMARTLLEAGLLACDVADSHRGLPSDGSWLRKPLRSGGGVRIEPWFGPSTEELAAATQQREYYFQRRVAGLACSAVFLAAQCQATLLGVTEQLVGTAWLNAKPFHYAGSLGPLRLAPVVEDRWRAIGRALAQAFPLVGLFGVDAIQTGDEIWPVEINPRYTASTEVLEWAGGFSAVALHVAACRSGEQNEAWSTPAPRDCGWYGKAILFAPHACMVPDAFVEAACAQNSSTLWPRVADIPHAGTILPAGSPVLSCLAAGESQSAVFSRLKANIKSLETMLAEVSLPRV